MNNKKLSREPGKTALTVAILLIMSVGAYLALSERGEKPSTPITPITDETIPAEEATNIMGRTPTSPDEITQLTPELSDQLHRAKEPINAQRLKEAREMLAPVYQAAPDHPEVIFEYAKLLRWEDRHEDAREILEEILPLHQDFGELGYYTLCLYIDLLIELIEHNMARQLVSEAAALNPDGQWHRELEAHLDEIDERIRAGGNSGE